MLALLVVPALAAETYPLTDPELLSTRRIETEALYLAVKKSGNARARYARTAMSAHNQRMDRLGPEMADAERSVEREGAGSGVAIERRYEAGDGRGRALAAGSAMARLLDDLRPGWRSEDLPMDVMLDEATSGLKPIPLSDDLTSARAEVKVLKQAQTERATRYITQAGYSVSVNATLIPTVTDPFEGIGLEDGVRVFLKNVELTHPAGTMRITGAGAYVGGDEARVPGLALEDLTMVHEGEELVVTGPGLDIRLRGALYTGQRRGMTIDLVPGTTMEADAAVFTLFAMATAAGYEGGDSELRDALLGAGRGCTGEMERFAGLAELDHPWLGGMLAHTVLLGDAPDFEPDREASRMALEHQRDGRFDALPDLLADFWTCARLEEVWNDARQDWIDYGQETLKRAAEPLAAGAAVDPTRWPHVRIVPNLLDRKTRGFSASWGDEVTVFLGPPHSHFEGPDPSTVVHEALHHVVDPEVRGRACPVFDAAHQAVQTKPAIAQGYPDPDVWLAESLVRALTVEAGVIEDPEAAERAWFDQGFSLVPGILAGLERESWDVWVLEQCGDPVPIEYFEDQRLGNDPED